MNNKILSFEKEIESLNEELHAVKNFNHTRFVEAQKLQGQADEQERKILEIDQKILEIEAKLASNLHNPEEPVYIKIKEELNYLLLEKEAIENFTHDEFLLNQQAMKAKKGVN